MKTQYQAFLEQLEFATYAEYLQSQVDIMRICQQSADELVFEEEANIDRAINALELMRKRIR
jgi:hypothetical protein